MKISVVDAGAVGGYFGGRLVQAGQDPCGRNLRDRSITTSAKRVDSIIEALSTLGRPQLAHKCRLIKLAIARRSGRAGGGFEPPVGFGVFVYNTLSSIESLGGSDP